MIAAEARSQTNVLLHAKAAKSGGVAPPMPQFFAFPLAAAAAALSPVREGSKEEDSPSPSPSTPASAEVVDIGPTPRSCRI